MNDNPTFPILQFLFHGYLRGGGPKGGADPHQVRDRAHPCDGSHRLPLLHMALSSVPWQGALSSVPWLLARGTRVRGAQISSGPIISNHTICSNHTIITNETIITVEINIAYGTIISNGTF